MNKPALRSVYLLLPLLLFCAVSFWAESSKARSRVASVKRPHLSQQTRASTTQAVEADVQAFELYLSAQGAACRELPEPAAQQLRRQLKERGTKTTLLEVGTTTRAAQQQTTQLKLILNGTSQLENFPAAKAALLRAAAKWEAIIQTEGVPGGVEFAAAVAIDFGPNFFGQTYQSSNLIGNSLIGRLGSVWVVPYSQFYVEQALNPHQNRIFAGLPYPIFTDIGQTPITRFTIPQRISIGFQVLPDDVEYKIGFNSAAKFDFDPSDGIDADKLDFEALALREFGRIVGFISNVGDREINLVPRSGPIDYSYSYPTIWDLYRVRPGVTLEDDTFSGATVERYELATRLQLSGGEQIMFTGDLEVPLSTGRPDGQGGDGRPAGHWKDDTLTGQYLGIMDPTYAPGERGGITATDLTALGYFTYRVKAETPVLEVLSVDDGSREQSLPADTALLVNRVTPARAPFTLQSVRVQFADGVALAGKSLRVVAFADPVRTGQPLNNPTLLVDRTITLQNVPESRLLEVMLPNPPVVNGGDLYVGVQAPQGTLAFAADVNGEARLRSFRSLNNGASFQPLQATGGAPLNLMLRAAVEAKYSAPLNAPPEIKQLSQTAALTTEELELLVFGRNFLPQLSGGNTSTASVVRINGKDQITNFLSASQLRARISSNEVRGKSSVTITVFTPTANGGLESNAVVLSVASSAPAPQVTKLEPALAVVGSPSLVVKVFGRDFKINSVARWNGVNRQTAALNGSELLMTLPASDLANATQASVTVMTPTPGGGVSSPLPFNVGACTYTLPQNSLNLGQSIDGGQLGAFMLETAAHCPWTLRSNDNWISLRGQTQGTGRFPLTFRATNNTTAAVRTGTLTVGQQTFTVRQTASLSASSAASFTTPGAAGAIATIFGTGLAKTTQAASTNPLPLELAGTKVRVTDFAGGVYDAPLFFVSPTQINFLIPDAAITFPVQQNDLALACLLSVTLDGVAVAESTLDLVAVAPSFFTADASGRGLPAGVILRLRTDGTQVFEPLGRFDPTQNRYVPRPIDLGPEGERVFLVLFGTGFRHTSGVAAVTALLGGVRLPVTFAGAQGNLTGLDQLNLELSRSLKGRGQVTLSCTINGRTGNPVSIEIQ